MKAIDELEREIKRREEEIANLRRALATLKGIKGSGAVASRAGTRRPRTEAEKRRLSAAMKRIWRKRKAAKKASQSGGKKGTPQ